MGELPRVVDADVLSAPKGDWRKYIIARRVRRETSDRLGWLAGRLRMESEGHLSRITASLSDLVDHPCRRVLEKAQKQDARKTD